jgi:hypothetical protein
MLLAVLFCLNLFQTSVPFKAESEFSIKFSLTLKKRAEVPEKDWVASDANAASRMESPDNNSPLPYLQAALEVLTKNPDEVKIRIVRGANQQILKKKIKEGIKEMVFADFVDDIKDLSGYTHTIYFLNEDGEPVSRIVIEFDEEGFYLVNGKKKGKL